MGELKQFFLPDTERLTESGVFVSLSETDSHHIRNVLRLRAGHQIRLIDTRSNCDALATIADAGGKIVSCSVDTVRPLQSAPPPVATLVVALLKGKKNEFVIEKATEFGVLDIHLVDTTNSEFKFHGDSDKARKLERWHTIAQAAAKQSRRDSIPELSLHSSLAGVLPLLPDADTTPRFSLSLEPGAREPLTFAPLSLPSVLAVGPEGDFSTKEYATLSSHSFKPLSLGSSILRAETAVIAGLAAIGAIFTRQ